MSLEHGADQGVACSSDVRIGIVSPDPCFPGRKVIWFWPIPAANFCLFPSSAVLTTILWGEEKEHNQGFTYSPPNLHYETVSLNENIHSLSVVHVVLSS